MKKQWCGIVVIFLLGACQQETNNKIPLAQVGERILYKEDIDKVLPENIQDKDSALWVDDFIKKWVRSELVILNAEQNLSPEQKNVDKELEEYRNSLLTYRYKNELLAQKMDTVITGEEVNTYYEKHDSEFVLKNNIVKAVYMKIPLEVANPETIKSLTRDEDPRKLAQLDEYSVQYAKTYDRFDDKWVNSKDVLNQFPEKTNGEERLLRRNNFIESSDTDYYYFICIRDFRLAGQVAPLAYVESEIRNILLNERKIKFLRTIEDDIYNEGLASNKFKIFNIKNK
ncbi:MAG: hypothetical protein ABFD10_17240 [Prolixibacteraceae bacterium]